MLIYGYIRKYRRVSDQTEKNDILEIISLLIQMLRASQCKGIEVRSHSVIPFIQLLQLNAT